MTPGINGTKIMHLDQIKVAFEVLIDGASDTTVGVKEVRVTNMWVSLWQPAVPITGNDEGVSSGEIG